MKRTGKYAATIIGLGLFFATSYYLSYRQALLNFNKRIQEQKMNPTLREHELDVERFAALNGVITAAPEISENEMTSENKNPSVQTGQPVTNQGELSNPSFVYTDGEDVLESSLSEENIILPETKIILETFDVMSGVFTSTESVPDANLVGMTREALCTYLENELNNMPSSEYEKGLISNEVIRFSNQKVIIRKTYDAEQMEYKYFVVVSNGEVVVYYGDRQRVYEYTGIRAETLKESDRLLLVSGIGVNSTEELFDLLESFSS